MKKWNIATYKHVLVWVVVVIYMFSANQIYNQLVLRDGKPLDMNIDLPVVSKDITFKLNDVMEPVRLNGQDLYELKGYAFKQINPAEADRITIVLVSASSNAAYPTNPVQYPNMIESYKGYTSAMDHAEFSLLIAKGTLKPGTYRIGIILEDPVESTQTYALTAAKIQKTPNSIKYIPDPG